MLSLIGIGLGNHEDITLKGLNLVKTADKIYLDVYTSKFEDSIQELEKFYGKKVIPADREILESDKLVEEAKTKNIVLLVIGDALSATTHIDLLLQAKSRNVEVNVVFNASIMTAAGITGLQLYKFGKTTSLVFWKENYKPENAYDILKQNKSIGAHTLCLLDITPEKCMTVKEAVEILLKIEETRKEKVFNEDTLCIGCARIGCKDQQLIAGSAKELLSKNFGEPLQCLIVVGEMHFVEEEAVNSLRI